ncbi:MAG: hypothetical protein KDA90_06950 [Planctomycetaceae bacterium]|nr:hypothetical protein [Planctomycetaceae bacterium]
MSTTAANVPQSNSHISTGGSPDYVQIALFASSLFPPTAGVKYLFDGTVSQVGASVQEVGAWVAKTGDDLAKHMDNGYLAVPLSFYSAYYGNVIQFAGGMINIDGQIQSLEDRINTGFQYYEATKSTSTAIAAFLGMAPLAEAIAGYDILTGEKLNGDERFDRGAAGLSATLSTAAQLGGAYVTANRFALRVTARTRYVTNGPAGAMFDSAKPLTSSQRSLLGNLQSAGAEVIVGKKFVSMNDLRNLTLHTGDEFAMLTRGGERMIVRGNGGKIPTLNADRAAQLSGQGWRFSGHTHTPGFQAVRSQGDINVLRAFGQRQSAIWGAQWRTRPGRFFGQMSDEIDFNMGLFR